MWSEIFLSLAVILLAISLLLVQKSLKRLWTCVDLLNQLAVIHQGMIVGVMAKDENGSEQFQTETPDNVRPIL
jgi:hypothetical protein